MRYILIAFMMMISSLSIAQITKFYPNDIRHNYVTEIEDMDQQEIRLMNQWRLAGQNNDKSLSIINAIRTLKNLKEAPATLINYSFETSNGSDGYNIGEANVTLELVNSTIKTISEITLTFDFYNDEDKRIYDINTGNQYMKLTFSNLKGRPKVESFNELANNIIDCYHFLTNDEATKIETFTNKKASKIELVGATIKYDDGSISNKISELQGNDLYGEGPLKPFTECQSDIYDREHSIQPQNTLPITPRIETESLEGAKKEGEAVFDVTDQMPSYPGGAYAMMNYIEQNKQYPLSAKIKGLQGRVVVSFIVEKDGSLTDIHVVRSVETSLDNESVRVIKSMPKWNPGKNHGTIVRVRYNVVVPFNL